MASQRSEGTLADSEDIGSYEQSAGCRSSAAPRAWAASGTARNADQTQAMSLHVSKLRGISIDVRNRLKRQGISYTHQLLREAGGAEQRRRLAARGEIDEAALGRLVRRADLARVKGIGAIFADMLELIGVDAVATLAQQEPADLHGRLYQLNAAERLARRAPTPEEVQDWVGQARALPVLVETS
jgi:predicted flap endonuclease-1-like 5' DNA nuclease